MNPITLIDKYYPCGTLAHSLLLQHSMQVAQKAVAIAAKWQGGIDVAFVEEAALLHDIGILYTDAANIGCHGDLPYLCHGVKGRELLEKEGLPRHALVCERHIGVGLTKADIMASNLPLPQRDMRPASVEEEIVAYADLFFSKKRSEINRERPAEEVRENVAVYGMEKVKIFDDWHARFGI